MRRLGVQTAPPETLVKQLQAVAVKRPRLKSLMTLYAKQYEYLRLAGKKESEHHRNLLLRLLRVIRRKL